MPTSGLTRWRSSTTTPAGRHTYAALDDRVRRMAAWLAVQGVGPGDRVAFLSENTIDIFEVLFACSHLKAILVPLNWRLAVPELRSSSTTAALTCSSTKSSSPMRSNN